MANEELLVAWVEQYYRNIIRKSNVNGVDFKYYQSLRGYFKHAIILTDIKQQEFTITDYQIWERILTMVKSGRNPVESGGIRFRFSKFEDICSRSSFYTTRKKLLSLELLIETPFKDYYIINPRYVIKLYNPKLNPDDGDEQQGFGN